MRTSLRALASALLSFITLAVIGAMNRLPYSSTRDKITDFLSFPGGFLAWLFYPGGVHGGYATRWAGFAIGGNLLFYALVWFVVLYCFQVARKKTLAGTKGEKGGEKGDSLN